MMSFRSFRVMGPLFFVAVIMVLGSFADAALVSYWPLDGDADAYPGYGVNGTLHGENITEPTPATDRNEVANGALAFDGANQQYVNIADGGGLDGAYVGTISMWVKWNGTQDADTPAWNYYGAVMGRQSNTGFSNNLIALGGENPAEAGVKWGSAAAAGPALEGATFVGDGVWRHVAVAFQPHFAGPSELFLNGASQGTVSAEALSQSYGEVVALTLGAWIEGGGSYSTAVMDDVAIFDDMLSASQISELYAQTKTPLTVGEGTDVEVPLRGVVATASSEWNERYADQTTDGVGRLTVVPDSYGKHGYPYGMWMSTGDGSYCDDPADPEPEITYDLGAVTQLSKMVVYNYNENYGTPDLDRGMEQPEIYYSENGDDWVLFGSVDLDLGTGDATNPPQEVNLGGISARYVKIDVDMAYQTDANQFVGVGEVDFYVGSSVLIPGDTNNNQIVDAVDAAVVASHWGAAADPNDYAFGNFNNDYLVDAIDAAIQAANWGDHTGGESAQGVPEPSTLVMIGSLMAFALWRRRVL